VSAHVLIPVKKDNGKSRLAGVLSLADRESLMRELLRRVVAIAQEAAVGPVTIVSGAPHPLEGIPRFDDRGRPWNDAIAEAVAAVVVEPKAVVLSADLPSLTADELRTFVEATPARGIAVARAQDGGTNAVAMRPPNAMRTHFGEPASAAVHTAMAASAGLDARIVDLPGLAFDVDAPADLERLEQLGWVST
jgi:2-phospho-L-lactate guanylyltransferase